MALLFLANAQSRSQSPRCFVQRNGQWGPIPVADQKDRGPWERDWPTPSAANPINHKCACANLAKFENILLNCYFQTIKHVSPQIWKYGEVNKRKRKRKTKQNKPKKNKTKQKQHENMTSRKVIKKKRHCLEFSKERWSIPSKKDFACQVATNFKQPFMSKLLPRRLTQFYLLSRPK